MNKIKYLLYTFLLLIPINVFAASISLGCPAEVKAGEEFVCTIYGPEHASELEISVNIPDNFVFKNYKSGVNYSITKNSNTLSFTGSGDHERIAATISFVAPNLTEDTNYTVGLNNIKYKFYSTDSNCTTDSNILKTILVKGKRITVPPTTEVAENFVATLDTNGSTDLNQTLSCTPKSGSCEVYLSSFTPTREGYVFNGWGLSKDCTEGERENYKLSSSLTLYACWEGSATTKVAYLNTLEVEGYDISFSKFKFEYVLEVLDTVENVIVKATPVNSSATVNINKPDSLALGENTITITVNDSGNTSVYTLKVYRGSDQVVIKNKLASLFVDNYDINFDSNKLDYTIETKYNVKKLEISAVTENINNTYEIEGNENLKAGSIVSINVLSGDGEVTTYTITIQRINYFKVYQTYIIIAAIVIFMLTVYFIVRHIKQKNGELKPKKEKKSKEVKEIKEAPAPTPETKKEEIETL